MPERQIPVLIDSSLEKAEGYVPSTGWSERPLTSVRRLQPSFVKGLRNSNKRREIEKEHGAVSATEWNSLRELLALIDRLNAGDWSPIITTDAKQVLKDLPALLDGLSPGGWFLEHEAGNGKMELRSASDKVRGSISFEIQGIERDDPSSSSAVGGASTRKVSPPARSGSDHGRRILGRVFTVSASGKTAAFALSEAFTAGLSKTRFVVWWSEIAKKLVPGLYCPDIVTALYALAMWGSGTSGGWAICQRCKKDYPRSRAKQRYCSHRCQAAAAMKRYRSNLEQKAKSKAQTPTKNKKSKGRK